VQKTVYAFVFLLLLTDILIIGFNVQLVGATGTIYIRADGSIDPPTAPISTLDNVTYTLTGDITSSTDCLTILRNNIIVDGNGHTLQGSGNGTGIYLPPGWENVTVRNTQIGGFEFGIYVFSSSSNSIVGNSISANVYEGIIIENSSNDRISENSVASTFGIELRRANNERVSGNNMANGNWSIYLYSSSSNSIIGNSIRGSNNQGILVDFSSANSIIGNNVTNSPVDIRLDSSSNNNISGNKMANGNWGLYLNSAYSNSVIGNSITANNYGIVLDNSSNNGFWHNFIGNAHQVSAGGNNIWDDGYPSGGNYWSDYNGTDLYSGLNQNVTGSDEIGDTPYVIDANNTDHYPLMRPFGVRAQSSTFVVCSPNLASVGSPVSCTATVSGQSPTGNVTWSTSSSTASFSQQVCTLSSGSCFTTYTDNNTGYVIITASYSGDSSNLPSNGSTTLTVFVNVMTGINVTVYPTNNLELTFANVIATGSVIANETPTVHAPTLNNMVGQYYTVKVNASFVGNVTVSLAFDGSNMTQQRKNSLQMVEYTPILGDVNGDGTVDILDAILLSNAFGTTPSSSNWNPNADVNGDGVVDILDAIILSNHFGQTASWVNITLYVDATSNIVYGQTTHFSYIGIH
jgi:parallel beta-helix repeat protein